MSMQRQGSRSTEKANLKVNSHHNTNMPGGQIITERVMTYSHGAGGHHLAIAGEVWPLLHALIRGA